MIPEKTGGHPLGFICPAFWGPGGDPILFRPQLQVRRKTGDDMIDGLLGRIGDLDQVQVDTGGGDDILRVDSGRCDVSKYLARRSDEYELP